MWTGIGIWMGWAAEEVCGGAGPYVVAQLLGSGLSFPVCHPVPTESLQICVYFSNFLFNVFILPAKN